MNHSAEVRKPAATEFCRRLWNCLPQCSIRISLLAKEALYISGAADNKIYFIERGRVKILVVSREGKECVLDICAPGEIVGESCLCRMERMEAAIAVTPSQFIAIDRNQFLEILTTNQLVEESFLYLASKLSEQQEIISHFVTADSERRLAATLFRLSRKLGKRYAGGYRIDEKITQEELANIVGTTRSRVGYFLKKFRAAGLMARNQSFLDINEELLAKFIQNWA
jgi:CRP/FNR family cyclic AMP-dependent transcriptional regulator